MARGRHTRAAEIPTALRANLSRRGLVGDNPVVQLRPDYPVLTPRLTLRPLTESDVEIMLAYRGRPDVCRYLPFEPMTRDILMARLAGDLSMTEITQEGQALTLGVEVTEFERLIGDVVLFFHSGLYRSGELGYVFDPVAGGQGYATEACTAMLAMAFGDLGLRRVVARIVNGNTRSVRLAERLGMHREPHLERTVMFKGQQSEELVYAIQR